jgi:secreted PhoX family phosphatase
MYGFITEVKITPGVGAGFTAVKHMAMGRAPWEMALTMPDNRTVYSTPDATNGGFYKFIANTQGDLSSGALYCAMFTQTSAVNSVGGNFNISWILMSNTSDAFLLNAVNGTANGVSAALSFDDIFNVDLPTSATSGACNTGFTSVNTGYSYKIGSTTYYNECLQRALPALCMHSCLIFVLTQFAATQ